MKKIVSLIAAFAALCVITTNAFALTCTGAVTGATIEGTTITYDATSDAGFVFKYIPDAELTTCTVTINVSELLADGWTVTNVDGNWSDYSDKTLSVTEGSTITYKWSGGSSSDPYKVNGVSVAQFKAVPGPASTIDGVKFVLTPVVRAVDKSNVRDAVTYTLAKAAPAPADKVTTEDTLTDGEGVVEFDYAADYVGNKAFEGKKVIFQNVETTRGNIKADTKVKVTRKSTNEVKYFGEKLYANWGVEGEGELAAKTIAFGLVIDAELDAADFEFVIE